MKDIKKTKIEKTLVVALGLMLLMALLSKGQSSTNNLTEFLSGASSGVVIVCAALLLRLKRLEK